MSSRYRTLAHGVRARHPGDAGSALDVLDVAGEEGAAPRRPRGRAMLSGFWIAADCQRVRTVLVFEATALLARPQTVPSLRDLVYQSS